MSVNRPIAEKLKNIMYNQLTYQRRNLYLARVLVGLRLKTHKYIFMVSIIFPNYCVHYSYAVFNYELLLLSRRTYILCCRKLRCYATRAAPI